MELNHTHDTEVDNVVLEDNAVIVQESCWGEEKGFVTSDRLDESFPEEHQECDYTENIRLNPEVRNELGEVVKDKQTIFDLIDIIEKNYRSINIQDPTQNSLIRESDNITIEVEFYGDGVDRVNAYVDYKDEKYTVEYENSNPLLSD